MQSHIPVVEELDIPASIHGTTDLPLLTLGITPEYVDEHVTLPNTDFYDSHTGTTRVTRLEAGDKLIAQDLPTMNHETFMPEAPSENTSVTLVPINVIGAEKRTNSRVPFSGKVLDSPDLFQIITNLQKK